MPTPGTAIGFLRSGTLAGAGSAVAFALVHQLFISDIWFSALPMMVAGAICGLFVSWSYGLLTERPSAGNWLAYNLIYVLMFGLLGAVSVLVFEPVSTIAALIASDGPPGELIRQAMPMTALFTLLAAGTISWLYTRGWRQGGAILLTCTVLVLILGLNVSVIGLVDIPGSSLYLIAELFGLIVAINFFYVIAFLVLERRRLLGEAV